MTRPDARPTIPALFKPSLLEWRAKYLADKAAQAGTSSSPPPTSAQPLAARRPPLTRK